MSAGSPIRLTPDERRTLLAVARGRIASALDGSSFSLDRFPRSPGVERPGAAFVSLHDAAGLRGCIGTLDPDRPLREAVAEAAFCAAFRDPRFPPVTSLELPRLAIEISVLGGFEPASPRDLVVGRDGVVIRDGSRAALLLPQVATEFGWTREQLLDHLCLKAGLPAGRWRSAGAELERFTAEVFSEVAESAGD